MNKNTPLAGAYTSCIGALSASGNVYLNPWLELQVIFTYSHAEGTLSGVSGGTLSEDWFSLMPSIKVAWAQNDIVQFYSRVGAGIALVNRTEGVFEGHAIRANIAFAWQVSPVGVEVGRRVRFFAEAGFGQLGVVSAGVKFNFNSMTYNGAGSRKILPEYHWYDTYLNKR